MAPDIEPLNCGILILGASGATALLTPVVIGLARKIGAIDAGGYRKINGRSIPLMGGLAVALPFLFACFLGIFHPTWLFGKTPMHEQDYLILLVGGGLILALGIVDDLHGLRAKTKFAFQLGVAVLVLIANRRIESVNIPLLGDVQLSLFTGALLSLLWIVGIINAINLIDGVDGLAGGVGLIGALGLGLIALLNGQTGVFILSLVFAGCLAGFLFFNFHPARCFLGDTGSQFIGFVLALLALMSSQGGTDSILLAPILVLGFPIFDTLTSIARRLLRGRNPFLGDRGHTHHRLLDSGYSQRQTAWLLYGVAALCSLAALLLQVFYAQSIRPLLVLGSYGLVFGAMAWSIGLLRPHQIVRVAQCRERNGRLSSFSRYAALALKNNSSALTLKDVLRLGCRTLNLAFLEVSVLDRPDLVTGFYGDAGREADQPRDGKCDSVRVTTAEGQWLLVRYRMNPASAPTKALDEGAAEMIELEREDVLACIASVFHGSRIELLSVIDSLDEGEAAGIKVHDMSDIVAKDKQALSVSAASVD